MKLLNTFEEVQVSGGSILSIDGKNIYVNTLGIPENCVRVIETMAQEVTIESNKPNATSGSITAVMGAQVGIIINANCNDYLSVFSDRLQSAFLI